MNSVLVTTAVMTVLKAAVTLATVHARPVLAVPTRAALSAPKAESVVNSVPVTTAVMTVLKAAVTLVTVHARPVLAVLTRAVLSVPKVANAVNSVHATTNVVAVIALKAAAMSVLKVVTLVIVRRTVATVTVPKAAPLIVVTVATTSAVANAATTVVASLKSVIFPVRLYRRPLAAPRPAFAPTGPLRMARTVRFPSSVRLKRMRARTIVPERFASTSALPTWACARVAKPMSGWKTAGSRSTAKSQSWARTWCPATGSRSTRGLRTVRTSRSPSC